MLWRSGTAAEGRLTAARAALTHLRSAIAAGDLTVAARRLHEVQVDCASARSRTSGPLWAVASSMPYAGRTPRAVRQIAEVADELARETLPGLVTAARLAAGDGLVQAGGGVDFNQLGRIGMLLDQADSTVGPIDARLRHLPRALVIGRVRQAGDKLRGQLGELRSQLDAAAGTVRVLPTMLGADGPRRYFLALQ